MVAPIPLSPTFVVSIRVRGRPSSLRSVSSSAPSRTAASRSFVANLGLNHWKRLLCLLQIAILKLHPHRNHIGHATQSQMATKLICYVVSCASTTSISNNAVANNPDFQSPSLFFSSFHLLIHCWVVLASLESCSSPLASDLLTH